nr:GNAT family N-acetyltransferase [Sulfobacillus harzensis]
MHAVLSRCGYQSHDIVEVLAWSLEDSSLPWPTLPLTNVGRPNSADDVKDAVTLLSQVFDARGPSSDELKRAVAEWRRDPHEVSGYYVARNHQCEIVGAAGLTLDQWVGKLWGSAVHPEWRHQGLYRQLVKLRAQAALQHGAKYCLVKARIGTSAPILLQAGFQQLATEICYHRRL